MLGEAHDILHEFPNLKDKINELHQTDPDFSSLMDHHDKVDKKIRELEAHDQPVSDIMMEDLKKERALLKDQIYEILRNIG